MYPGEKRIVRSTSGIFLANSVANQDRIIHLFGKANSKIDGLLTVRSEMDYILPEATTIQAHFQDGIVCVIGISK